MRTLSKVALLSRSAMLNALRQRVQTLQPLRARALCVSRAMSSSSSAPPPLPPVLDPSNRLAVLFPRRGSYQASIDIKRRVLALTPHMGGKTLKKMVRHHARRGTMDSFVGDLESRIDRFIYRINLVPSIFAAKQVIGHGHIMVNGRVTRRAGQLLQPHDIVEPTPKAVPLFKRLIRTRLATNTFVFRDEKEDSPPPWLRGDRGVKPPKYTSIADFDVERLRNDAAAVDHHAQINVLPVPKARTVSNAAAVFGDDELGEVLLSLLPSLCGNGAMAAELRRRRAELSVLNAPSGLFVIWQKSKMEEPLVLMKLNTAATRRLLLGMLALKREEGA